MKDVEKARCAVTAASLKPSFLNDPDVQLMLRVKDEDERAFEDLVDRYQSRLINIFAHQLGDAGAAEDLTQEVFLRIYRARHGYEPAARFSTWVFRIAQNLASNRRRSRSRRKEVELKAGSDSGTGESRLQESSSKEKSAVTPARRLDDRELQEAVRAALQTLNERQRMALLLHKFEDMSYEEIAAVMEITPQAVKSLLSRARENLRLKLDVYMK